MQLRWRHVIINTHSSWLHGSPMGFRSREHRIHSSGDYRNPPPAGEHERLLEYQLARSSPKVLIPETHRPIIGTALISFFQTANHELLALSVSDLHAHFVVDLPEDLPAVKAIVGRAKEKASRVANIELAGFRWSAGGTYKLVRSDGHLWSSAEYVLTKQGHGAWTWCPKCGEPRPDRKCPFRHD
jgi:REP element-mobilizing transposase RayT